MNNQKRGKFSCRYFSRCWELTDDKGELFDDDEILKGEQKEELDAEIKDGLEKEPTGTCIESKIYMNPWLNVSLHDNLLLKNSNE